MKSFVLPAFSLILVACSASSAVVGGECRAGYTMSGEHCVGGSTPNAIGDGDGNGNDLASTNATDPTTATKVASTPIGSASTSSSSSSSGSSPALSTPPDTSSPPPSSDLVCDASATACHGACISVQADAQNCGACGRSCPSNICVAGVCQGATPGDIVVIGHDMSQAPQGSTHAKVFTNAMMLPTTDPVRILAFESDASPGTIDKTRSLVFGATTRQIRLGSATPDMLADDSLYAQWDVVLVDAVLGSNAADYGSRWGHALDTFTRAGGVLVGLDDGSGDVPTFFRSTGLLDLGTHTAFAPDMQFVVSAPNDTVGAHLLSPYAAYGMSWGFVGATAPTTNLAWVVQSANASAFPTVLHKVAR